MKDRIRALLWGALVLAVLIPVVWLAQKKFEAMLVREHSALVHDRLGVHARSLAGAFGRLVATLDAIGTMEQTTDGSEHDRFEQLSRGLRANMPWVRSIQIVTAGVITHVYPHRGNEAVEGYDLLTDPRPVIRDDVVRAISTGRATITGPIELIQGGLGLIIRRRIAVGPGGQTRLAAIVLNLSDLLDELGLPSVAGQGARESSALRVHGGATFFGATTVFDTDAARVLVPLPDGAWELGAIPRRGWAHEVRGPARAFAAAGLIIALLLAALTTVVSRRHRKLSATVDEQTADLARQHALMRAVLDGTDDAVFVKDVRGRYLLVNDAAAGFVGRSASEIIGRDDSELFDVAGAAKLMEHDRTVRESGVALTAEETATADGVVRTYLTNKAPYRDATGAIVGTIGVSRDISEAKRREARLREAEAQLLRSQRLEALGTLAGGIAHDLNNALTPIVMGLSLLREEYPKESELVAGFFTSAKRAGDMVRQLVTFARGSDGQRVPLSVRLVVKEMEAMIGASFPKSISLEVQLDADVSHVRGDATQVHQVLLNLCVNARDAMPTGGTITLRASRVVVDAAFRAAHPHARDGEFVALQVADTGAGIALELQGRVLEPFFSTKTSEKGTGLGLATVAAITKGHDGFLEFASVPGEGTTFIVYLPTAPSAPPAAVDDPSEDLAGNGELILFVDDEEQIRTVASAVLRKLGYRVVLASGGEQALEHAAANADALRAVVTDVHMPQMGGVAFARALRARFPALPVMVVSGHLDEAEAVAFRLLDITVHLEKPQTDVQLARELKRLLAGPRGPASP